MKESPLITVNNGRWIKVIVEIIIVLFAVAAAWATLRRDVRDNCTHINKHDTKITAMEKGQAEIKGDIRVIRTEQKYISEGIDDIKDKLE